MSLQQFLPARSFAAAVLAAGCLLAVPLQAQDDKPKLDIHFVPTPQEVVDRMLEMVDVQKDDFVIDLGSGDGRIPVTAAKKYGVNALGVDLDPQRIKEANENAQKNNVTDKVKFEQKNLFDQDLSKADVITMYLFPSINLKLRPTLLDLEPGTRVVSHAFNMGDWEPDQKDEIGSRDIYMWVVPAKVEGRWTVKTADGKEFTLDLKQKYQQVTGTADMNGRSVPIKDVELDGKKISFAVDMGEGKPMTFSGTVDGNAIGASEASGAAKGWSASRAS